MKPVRPSALLLASFLVALLHASTAWSQPKDPDDLAKRFTRSTEMLPMRDGAKLHTIVYSPKNEAQKYPILMTRTPYGIAPYEEDKKDKASLRSDQSSRSSGLTGKMMRPSEPREVLEPRQASLRSDE